MSCLHNNFKKRIGQIDNNYNTRIIRNKSKMHQLDQIAKIHILASPQSNQPNDERQLTMKKVPKAPKRPTTLVMHKRSSLR